MMVRVGMMHIGRRREKGLTLLEMIIAVGVFATLLMAIFGILQTFAQREVARATVRYMETVSGAVMQILESPANYNALYNEAILPANGGGLQLVADPAGAAVNNIAVDFQVGASGRWIGASPLLPANFQNRSPLGTPIRILLRATDDTTVETDTRGLEVIIVTSAPRPDDIVGKAALFAGAQGGFIRDYAGKPAAVMQSAFASWSVTPADRLANTNWYTNDLRNAIVAETDGSYFVYYTYANLEDRMGDYLYRVADPSDPAGRQNTMYGPLNIGGNDIVGADDVAIGGGAVAKPFSTVPGSPADCANGVLCVNGTAAVKGAAYVGGFMTVNGNMTVADSMEVQSMRMENAMSDTDRTTYNAQSLFVVDGPSGNQDEIIVTGPATFNNGLTASDGTVFSTAATTVTVPQGANPGEGIFETNTIGVSGNARRLTATTINARTLNVPNVLKAGDVSAGNVTVTGSGANPGRTGVLDIVNTQNLVYGTAASPRALSVPRANIDELSIDSFGACTNGCGQ